MRQSHIVDDLMGRMQKLKDNVQFTVALPGEAILGCREGTDGLNLVSWILRWNL